MGCLRLLLASLVLASHSGTINVYAGTLAVECFFAISGFYIQMIIREQYMGQAQWRRKLLESRLLRIFVPYWAVLLGIVVIYIIHPIGNFPVIADRLSVFLNVFIIGTEEIKLLRTATACTSEYFEALMIPQIWSVGIELLFYALAPWLLTCRTKILAMIFAIGVAAKIIFTVYLAGPATALPCGDGLLNGIMPIELCVFLAGALAWRFYKYFVAALPAFSPKASVVLYVAIGLMTAILLMYNKGNDLIALWEYYLYLTLIIALMPMLFFVSRTLKWDKTLGELSYPFYLWHLFIVHQVATMHSTRWGHFILAEIITLILSCAVVAWVDRPLDRFRHRHFRRTA